MRTIENAEWRINSPFFCISNAERFLPFRIKFVYGYFVATYCSNKRVNAVQ